MELGFTCAANSVSASDFATKDMIDKMNELSQKMRSTSNVFVATAKTVFELREAINGQENQFNSGCIPSAIMGLPIERYPTIRECLDRMTQPRSGERLQLVLSDEIPMHCASHPYMKSMARSMADHYSINYAIAPANAAIPSTENGEETK
jgi:hypothetical protein